MRRPGYIFVVAVLAVSLMTACGSGGQQSGQKQEAAEEQQQEVTAETASTVEAISAEPSAAEASAEEVSAEGISAEASAEEVSAESASAEETAEEAPAGEAEADVYSGEWTEKSAERIVMSINPSNEAGWYDIEITWREDLPQKDVYDMRAQLHDDGCLYYDNCRYVIRTFADDGSSSDEVKYENGSGLLNFDRDADLLYWTDYELPPEENVTTFFREIVMK